MTDSYASQKQTKKITDCTDSLLSSVATFDTLCIIIQIFYLKEDKHLYSK